MKRLIILFFLTCTVYAQPSEKVILFLGNSLTAAYGVEPELGFTAHIQKKIDQAGLLYKVVNAGLSGETTSAGLRRLDWLLKRQIDVLVIELGGNDGLRGIMPSLSKDNLQAMIDKARAANPNIKILLCGMMAPPNMGETFTKQFRAMYPELAKKNTVPLIPFLLEGVADKPELNLPDFIHPNVDGHKIVAETVWKYLKPLL